jgi:hypothetical protein
MDGEKQLHTKENFKGVGEWNENKTTTTMNKMDGGTMETIKEHEKHMLHLLHRLLWHRPQTTKNKSAKEGGPWHHLEEI